jgi:hypothetical protein
MCPVSALGWPVVDYGLAMVEESHVSHLNSMQGFVIDCKYTDKSLPYSELTKVKCFPEEIF